MGLNGLASIIMSGSNGWLGRALCAALAEKDFDVVRIGIDQMPHSNSFYNTKMRIGILAGTNYGHGLPPEKLAEQHLRAANKFLSASSLYRVQSIIYVDTLLTPGYSAYADVKRLISEYLKQELKGRCKLILLKLNTFFGANLTRRSFTQDLIRAFFYDDEYFEIRAPQNIRDFIYIKDVVRSILFVIEMSERAEFLRHGACVDLEIGSGKPRSFIEFAAIGKRAFSARTEIIKIGTNEEAEVLVSNCSKLSSLGWQPSFSEFEAMVDILRELRQAAAGYVGDEHES